MRFVATFVTLLFAGAYGCTGAPSNAPAVAAPQPIVAMSLEQDVDTAANAASSPAAAADNVMAATTGNRSGVTAPTLLPLSSAERVTGPALRPFTLVNADYGLPALERARRAKADKRAIVEQLFSRAGVAFPPARLLLRGYKKERELEVWAASKADSELVQITSYTVCAASGELGPKRKEGDFQVPEGFYKIQYLWPNSAFYLSMKVGYPNLSDRILGDRRMPGSDIMIHGGCASIGCLAMSDERIQELWVMASAVYGGDGIHVHLFPTREPAGLRALPQYKEQQSFWQNLYQGHDLFERHRRLPRVKVEWDGRYSFAARAD